MWIVVSLFAPPIAMFAVATWLYQKDSNALAVVCFVLGLLTLGCQLVG